MEKKRDLVFNLDTLIISSSDWNIENKKYEFISYLKDCYEMLSQIKLFQVIFSNTLEALLWGENSPPWTISTADQRIVTPIIYDILSKYRKNETYEIKKKNNCIISPNPNYDFIGKDTINEFYKILSFLIDSGNKVIFCMNPNDNNCYKICSKCKTKELDYFNIKTKKDWLNLIDITEYFWPKDCYDGTSLKKALDYFKLKISNDDDVLFKTDFCKNFIENLLEVKNIDRRNKIIMQIIKRLTKSTHELAKDYSLKDELIDEERRFRISLSTRIHYKISEKTIYFLRYYKEGQHDDGL